MPEPPRYPGRIRTDPTNAFANHTMRVRVPAIVRGVLERNLDYEPRVVSELEALAGELESGGALPGLTGAAPGADEWRAALSTRDGESWLGTDWLFAEPYAYRQLVERVGFWESGRDPFLPNKREEYASTAHAEAFERALAVSGSPEERLFALFALALFGNRIDLSFAASREHGLATAGDDLLLDDREAATRAVFDGTGPLHVIADNAGTELTLDLTLVDFVLSELGVPVVMHLKTHPTFVSDATIEDVRWFLGLGSDLAPAATRASRACVERLASAVRSGTLELRTHPFWNGPASLWEFPAELARELSGARLVVLKGDANYRRALGDAMWPVDTTFGEITEYFPGPLLALRTLKSDTLAGLAPVRASELDRVDATWHVNGKRGVASLGGTRRSAR